MKIDPKYKAVGFDMDGTLLDTNIDYERLGNVTFDTLTSLGVPPERINTHESDRDMIIHAKQYLESIGTNYSIEELSSAINKRAAEIEMENVDSAKAFPGAEELLKELKAAGYPVGLLTRGQRKYAETAMGMCGLLGYMDAVEAFDDHPAGEQKPNPIAMVYLSKRLDVRPEEILYIGDSVWDYRCAHDAGSGFIGISAGEAGRKKWAPVSGVELVSSVKDLV